MKTQLIALTRAVSSSINYCELTHKARESIQVDLARYQHHHYEKTLSMIGCQVMRLPEEPHLPDAVFVEDTAVVLDEVAIISRPGAESRRAETTSIAAALTPHRQLAFITEPGTLDGGDVLVSGRTIYVGVSARSNIEGFYQLRSIASPLGYSVVSVRVKGCLHLKSAVTQVSENTMLMNPEWIDPAIFSIYRTVIVDKNEPYAANALYLNESVLYPTAYPKTSAQLKEIGINIHYVNLSELIKAEGAVTCCSLLFKEGPC